MATVSYAFFGSRVGPAYDLDPGDSHSWSASGGSLNYGDAITVTAHGIRSTLSVRNVRTRKKSGDRIHVEFDVHNVGNQVEVGYGIGFAWIDR